MPKTTQSIEELMTISASIEAYEDKLKAQLIIFDAYLIVCPTETSPKQPISLSREFKNLILD